jgi:hypothetical protein
MIIVKLMGGLGNQLFQYAAARSLSVRLKTVLKLDLSFLEGDQPGDTPRSFALGHFAINAVKASRWETTLMSGKGANFLESVIARRLHKIRGFTSYRENQFQVNPAFFSLSDNVHLEGFWQSECYFADFRDTIREEFTVKTPLIGKNLEAAEVIRAVNAVSLHVRRGDYVTNEKTRAYHYVCDAAYYRKAEELLTQRLESPHFFVFSDDPEWVVGNLKLRHPTTYIDYNGAAPHEDLRLMSLCRHHVIANSSFSWWGAWLSTGSDKLVVAPGRWFNDPSIDTSDLTPAGWMRI